MISRIFTLCIPFVGSLAVYWKPLPLVVLGTPTVLSGCLALLLPETSGKDLPQTIYEADQVTTNIRGVPIEVDLLKLWCLGYFCIRRGGGGKYLPQTIYEADQVIR
jgi:hypothetical protein